MTPRILPPPPPQTTLVNLNIATEANGVLAMSDTEEPTEEEEEDGASDASGKEDRFEATERFELFSEVIITLLSLLEVSSPFTQVIQGPVSYTPLARV